MPDARIFTGGQYIKCETVEGMTNEERHVTVDHVEVEFISGREKLVMYFSGHKIGLPLNTTNIEELCESLGTSDTDDWAMAVVELYVDPSVRYQGRRVGGVRVRCPILDQSPEDGPIKRK